MKTRLIILLIIVGVILTAGCTQNAPETLSPVVFQPQPKIDQIKAAAIASHYVPIEVAMRSDIIPNLSYTSTGKDDVYTWSIIYENAGVNRQQLEASGWQADADTYFDSNGPYSAVIITIDADTGELLHKTANYGLYLGGPPASAPISEDEAKIIASRFVPSNIITRSRIEAILNAKTAKQFWLIYYIVDVTQSELGWHASKDTHLNNLKSGEKYFELVIEIDMDTGNFIQRSAFTLSQAEPPSLSTPITQSSPTSETTNVIPTATNIQINPKPGDYLVDKNGNKVPVLLKSVSPIYADIYPGGYYNQIKHTFSSGGDPCLVLPFQVESYISKVQYLDISARGYDGNGNLVSYCLNIGPIWGQTVVEMQPDSINDVEIALSPSQDLVRVEIVVIGLSDIVPP